MRWVDNIKIDLALVNVVMNLQVPFNAGKLSSGYIIVGL
jgi:hypothetical protein